MEEQQKAEIALSDAICDAMQEAEKNLSYIQILGILENAKGCYMYLRMSKGESK